MKLYPVKFELVGRSVQDRHKIGTKSAWFLIFGRPSGQKEPRSSPFRRLFFAGFVHLFALFCTFLHFSAPGLGARREAHSRVEAKVRQKRCSFPRRRGMRGGEGTKAQGSGFASRGAGAKGRWRLAHRLDASRWTGLRQVVFSHCDTIPG